MTKLSVEAFVELVHRSRLIDKDLLAQRIAAGTKKHTANSVAKLLVDEELLTEWQAKNLLLGKTRGFFLGDYRLLRHIGTGGMSSVFLARHGQIDREVAIKVLPHSKTEMQFFLDRFDREGQATAKLSHPNIVRVFDIDTHDDTHFMVMEYVDGKDLQAIVKETGALPLTRATHYIAQAATGLHHAHQRGLVHRDIKAANIVVNQMDLVKILDLGLARVNDDELASITSANSESMMGTADYLSPEQALNAHTVDHRADLYSLGCTFYYLLTGQVPFTEGTMAQRILMHQNQRPTDVRAIREDCPHAIADVCMTMLAKLPDDRPENGNQIAARLSRWLVTTGFDVTSTTYAAVSEQHIVSLPVAPTEPTETPQAFAQAKSLTNKRKTRQSHAGVKNAVGVWIFLGVATVLCIALLVYSLLR